MLERKYYTYISSRGTANAGLWLKYDCMAHIGEGKCKLVSR